MFSITKSTVLDEVQSEDGDVNKRHYEVKFYRNDLPLVSPVAH